MPPIMRIGQKNISLQMKSGHEHAATTTTGACSTGVTMIAGGNGSIQELIDGQRGNVECFAFDIPNRQLEHLIEIAIVNRPFPADAYESTAHHLVYGCG